MIYGVDDDIICLFSVFKFTNNLSGTNTPPSCSHRQPALNPFGNHLKDFLNIHDQSGVVSVPHHDLDVICKTTFFKSYYCISFH